MRDPDVCPWSWWVKGKGIEKGKGSVCSSGRWLQEVGGVGQLPTSGEWRRGSSEHVCFLGREEASCCHRHLL